MLDEEIVSSRTVYSGRAVKLRVDTVRLPGGRETTREIIEHADCVAVVPFDAEGNVLLVEQFRHATGKTLLEIPAGGIEYGETPEEAVRRELKEEIGFEPQKIERLGGFYAAPGYCTEYLHLFLATELVPSQLHAEDTEEIRVVTMPVNQISEMISSGRICDAKSVAGLLYFLRFKAG
ncbi:MAG: NUDIX hydrolase [Chloroflexi bacterium]|nr:NUDIX hydrolase [Chloroflexota bacterium]